MLPFRDNIPARRYPLMTLTIVLAFDLHILAWRLGPPDRKHVAPVDLWGQRGRPNRPFSLFIVLSAVQIAGWLRPHFFNLDSRISSFGASGAVTGVLGSYLVSYPFAHSSTLLALFLFWSIVRLPAVLVLGS